MKKSFVAVAALASIVAASASTVNVVHADPVKLSPGALALLRGHTGCGSVTADGQLTFVSGAAAVGMTSPNASYNHGDNCQAFVVDFSVGAAAQAPAGYVKDIILGAVDPDRPDYALGVSQAQCASYIERVSIYKKIGVTFTLIGGGWLRGQWVTQTPGEFGYTGCVTVHEAGFKTIPIVDPPAAGADTYRVATSISLNGTFRRVRAQANHLFAPPG